MSYKIGKTMEARAANTLIEETNMEFLKETGKFLPKLLSSSEVEITQTIPKEVFKELLNKGILDKDMFLNEEEGAKKSLKKALMAHSCDYHCKDWRSNLKRKLSKA